jgi:redox-sensitive bicupin YhaK (pirin superfamily)
MSAGTGVMHSEFNPSGTDPVHFFQIWLEPATTGTPSSYEQIRFDPEDKRGKLKLLAGPHGGDGVARINQDAKVFVTELAKGDEIAYPLGSQRHAWVHVIRGAVTVNGATLSTGDAAGVENEEKLVMVGAEAGKNAEPNELLLFDLA